MSKAGRLWWGFLATLLALAVWLCSTGNVVLHGVPLEVLEALARGKGLLDQPSPPPDGVALLGALPGDALAWTSAVTTLTNALGALALFLAGVWAWRNPVGPTLAVGVAFFSASTMWVKTGSPQDSLIHLVLALSLAALVGGAVPVLAGLVLALAVLSPEQAIMMYLALAYLSYRRQPAYGLMVPTLAMFGVGCLLIPMAGDYRLEPSLRGWQILSLVPLALSLLPTQIRAARGGIYLALLLGSALTGTAEVATILAVGDLVFVALERLRDPAPQNAVPGRRLSGPALLSLGATLLLVWAVLPGERYLNRHILIPAQKAKVPLGELFGFFSLAGHARNFHEAPWRTKVPFPELGAPDFELAIDLSARPLSQGFCPITTDSQSESRAIALVYALVSGQPLRGWDDSQHLAAPLLLCKRNARNYIKSGPAVIFRDQSQARLVDPPAAPKTSAPLDFRSVLMLPYRPQTVSQQAGAAYRWASAGRLYELSFVDQPAQLVFSSRPGEYRISSLAEKGGAVRHFEVPEVAWELSGLSQDQTLPSRSLVPISMRLTNRGLGPISSDLVASWRIETTAGGSFSPFVQPSAKNFILYPGESTEVSFQLATPEPEGIYTVSATAITPEGKALEVPFSGSSQVRTWRRLPPVGTWVEEP